MTKFGQVTAYNEQTGEAAVRYARPEACEACGACGKSAAQEEIVLRADCQVGDWVQIEFPEGRFIKAVALTYGLPLFGLMGGLVLGYSLGGKGDLPTLAGGAIGLCLALGLLRLSDRRVAGRPDWTPKVVRVYAENPTKETIGCEATRP